MLGPSPVVHDRSGACRGGARSSRPSVAHRDLPIRNCASGCVCLIGIHASVRCAAAPGLQPTRRLRSRRPVSARALRCGLRLSKTPRFAFPTFGRSDPPSVGITRRRPPRFVPPYGGTHRASGLPDKRRASGSASSTFAAHPLPVAPQSLRSQRSAIASVSTDLPVPIQRPMLAAAARRHRAAKSGGHPARRGTATPSYRPADCLFPHIGTGHLVCPPKRSTHQCHEKKAGVIRRQLPPDTITAQIGVAKSLVGIGHLFLVRYWTPFPRS